MLVQNVGLRGHQDLCVTLPAAQTLNPKCSDSVHNLVHTIYQKVKLLNKSLVFHADLGVYQTRMAFVGSSDVMLLHLPCQCDADILPLALAV